jgi:hypothetical protein
VLTRRLGESRLIPMREINLTAPALKALTDDELAAMFAAAEDDALQALVISELDRRDRCARERAARHAVNEEWFLFAHAQYLAAEAETNGYLLNKAGRDAGIDPWTLWSGPASRVEKYASDELRDFWLARERVTVMEWAARTRRAQREQREASQR